MSEKGQTKPALILPYLVLVICRDLSIVKSSQGWCGGNCRANVQLDWVGIILSGCVLFKKIFSSFKEGLNPEPC
jgi:hypothetical protein